MYFSKISYLNSSMIFCTLIGVAESHVGYSFIKFFFEFCLQIVGQDII
jgi:hypothetical protein